MPLLTRLLAIALFTAASPAHAGFGLWLQEKALGLEQQLAALETRQVRVDDHDVPVFVRQLDNGQPCAVLIHGFTARGAHWFRLARHLPDDRCIISLDLPGFGDASYLPTASYDIQSQARRLHGVLDALGVDQPVDLMGNSMGGNTAAVFTLTYPERVRTLTLLNASGVSSPLPSTLRRQIEAGENGFFATDLRSFKRFYRMTMSEPPFVPGVIRDAVGKLAIERVPRHQRIFAQLDVPPLDARLGEIQVPTLIVWGDEDHLLDVSMTQVWRRIAGSRVFIYRGIGHMPHLERPSQTADLFQRFTRGEL